MIIERASLLIDKGRITVVDDAIQKLRGDSGLSAAGVGVAAERGKRQKR